MLGRMSSLKSESGGNPEVYNSGGNPEVYKSGGSPADEKLWLDHDHH